MTIENHEWSDKDIYCDLADKDEIELLSDGLIDQIFINKDDAKAIAEHFGLVENYEKPDNAIDLRKEMNAKIKAIKDEYRALIRSIQGKCKHEFGIAYTIHPYQYGAGVKVKSCTKCGKEKKEN